MRVPQTRVMTTAAAVILPLAALVVVGGLMAPDTGAGNGPTAGGSDPAPAPAVVATVVANDYLFVSVPPGGGRWQVSAQRRTGAGWAGVRRSVIPDGGSSVAFDVPPGRYRVVAEPAGGRAEVVATGRVSDRRPPARRLRPTPQKAYADTPASYRDGCHADSLQTRARICTYGVRSSREAILMIGDSQLAQWLGAVEPVAVERGLRIDYATKSSCPASDATVGVGKPQRPYRECDAWRASLFERLRGAGPYQAVIAGDFDRYRIFSRAGVELTAADADAEWGRAAGRTAAQLLGQSGTVLWLRGIHDLVIDPPRCLKRHPEDVGECDRFSAGLLDSALGRWRAKSAALAGFPQVRPVDLTDSVCSNGVCTVNQGRVLKYRDRYHLTGTFAARLAGQLGRILERR